MAFRRRARRVFRKKRPALRRRVRRTFRRKRNMLPGPTRLINKVLGGFPDRYFSKHKVSGTLIPASQVANVISFKGNSLITVGPSINSASGTGAYASNYPAGVAYLLGSGSDNPGVAPYRFYRVWSSAITIRYVPTSSGPSSITTSLYPALEDGLAYGTGGLPAFNVAGEQPYSKIGRCAGNNTNRGLTAKAFMTTRRIWGFTHKASIEGNNNFFSNYNSSPGSLWFWNFCIYGDGSTNLTGIAEYDITYYVEFFGRDSPFSSVAPS